ncbi:MAG: GNAT family N-acetyltransferase [Parachlamydiaceae bacterium]|nr:GNAT family N-acetyltransferase [Parachlamydiaceae bacterium]
MMLWYNSKQFFADIQWMDDIKMKYSVENVSQSSQQEMLNFLKEHENYSLFLLGNFESYGATLTEAPYSGNYKLIRSLDKIEGVFCLTKTGNLLIESATDDSIFEMVVEACIQEKITLKGLIGNWNYCGPFWEYLKSKKIIKNEIAASKEILYCIDLSMQDFPAQSNVRFLTEADYIQWKILIQDYIVEQGFPNDLTDHQLLDQFLDKTNKKIIWGLFLKNTLVSIADLNAKALDLGQVGGVYTHPNYRQKGYSRSVMQQLLLDAKKVHKIRKLIIFTGDNNFPAQKLYKSLGVESVGYFALLFGTSD